MRRELQSSGCSETNEGFAAADNETCEQEVKQSMHENCIAWVLLPVCLLGCL
jgi:hypothetical protein